MTTVFKSTEEMLASTGLALGTTDWVVIDQARIDLFAEATGDHQWIHVDPVRAADGPFGCTVAHGYLTLSLANLFLPQLMQVQNMQMGVNYGCDKVRFPAPVKVGSRVRGRGEVIKVEQVGAAVQQTVRVSVEIEGAERPGCVVDTVSRYTFNPLSE
ncbi:Probable enoyl-CoA hydratase 1 [Streptococcus pneumoniae]|uniref:MaoC family dehydratase n=1 Tax=Stutzerimonas stutzeri TaxID=316 RepID=A0AA40V865_STUST|nr:MaoC family dehydratase [Stutzerimonas stutzeri]CJL66598.1 Probable enoyl-CoA hydratase 1 [Streptococcus pneumoniae]HAJ85881.1 MaoC family dehydratase [Pseudomonas sp.]MBA1306551.1 MaoC family dehydratase [Stutzerimonas stutzeri]MCQ4226025.1 MaoC family dehydratase [Stutzerimonas stutzeri]MDH0444492.1 MaoC family dehydratase [Stutzerimonas stutzeri]